MATATLTSPGTSPAPRKRTRKSKPDLKLTGMARLIELDKLTREQSADARAEAAGKSYKPDSHLTLACDLEGREFEGKTALESIADDAEPASATMERTEEYRADYEAALQRYWSGAVKYLPEKLRWGMPLPLLLLGMDHQWPLPEHKKGHPCPVCEGRKLKGHELCLCCHRAGCDWKLPPVKPSEMPRAERFQHKRDQSRELAGGIGKSKREVTSK